MYELIKDGKVMPQLLECPFCRSSAKNVAVNDDNKYVISCEKCGATVWGKTLLEVATRWNTRGGHFDECAALAMPPLVWCKARLLRDNGKWGDWAHGYVTRRDEDVGDLWQINDGTGVRPLTIDPATVCEFTGIRDANGYPVYNGDILERGDKKYRRFIVSYYDGSFWGTATPPEVNDAPISVWGLVHNYAAIVVSNLFDNPDAYAVAKD